MTRFKKVNPILMVRMPCEKKVLRTALRLLVDADNVSLLDKMVGLNMWRKLNDLKNLPAK